MLETDRTRIMTSPCCVVAASSHVADAALRRACYVLRFLLADRLSTRQAFYAAQSRVAVMAHSESIRDLPEYDFLPSMFDTRVRALAGTPTVPVTAIGEENLLCFSDDENRPEDTLVRELAVSILLTAVPLTMPKLRRMVDAQYELAMASGLWEDTFASKSPELYFVSCQQRLYDLVMQLNGELCASCDLTCSCSTDHWCPPCFA